MDIGTISRVNLERGFGFINPEASEDPDVFFHKTNLDSSLPWDATLTERRVKYQAVQKEKGPAALHVSAAD